MILGAAASHVILQDSLCTQYKDRFVGDVGLALARA